MRKMMTKEVQFTTLELAKIEVVEGVPTVVTLPDEIILGTINADKAQKLVNKKHNTTVTIVSSVVTEKTYEMPVEEFIKLAKVQGEPTGEPPAGEPPADFTIDLSGNPDESFTEEQTKEQKLQEIIAPNPSRRAGTIRTY